MPRPATFDTDRPAEQRPIAGVGLRLLTALLLAVMFALVKLASTRGVNLVESLFYRQCGSALCAVGLVAAGPGSHRCARGASGRMSGAWRWAWRRWRSISRR